MRPSASAWLLAALLAASPLASAFADSLPPVPVRVGTHEGYSRVAFNLPSRTEYHVTQEGQHVVVEFAGNVMIGAANAVPRNVLTVTGGAGQAEIVVAPGTIVRDWRLGNLVVIDILDRDAADARPTPHQAVGAGPTPAKPSTGVAAQSPSPTPAAEPPTAKPPTGVATTSTSATPAAEPPTAKPPPGVAPPGPPATPAAGPAPVEPPPMRNPETAPTPLKLEAANPLSEPASPAAPPSLPAEAMSAAPAQPTPTASVADTATPSPSGFDAALVVPSGPQLGVAVFRRGRSALIVFDQPRGIDLSPLHDDPIFGAASVQTLQTATVVRLPLEPTMALSPSRTRDAWRIAAVPLGLALRPIQASVVDDRFVLRASDAGSVISLVDPDTGATLLVGTQRREGQGVPALRRSAEFTLLPTWQGVALEPHADTVMLRPTSQGFVVAGAFTLSPSSDYADLLAGSAGLTRHFDFPNQPTAILLGNLRRQVAEAATTSPLGRGPHRQTAARTMIALGLGAEAGAMLNMAATDDPHAADSPDNIGLASIAALLAHRSDEADGIADARLPAADDIALWRAVRLAQLSEGSAPAAAMFAATLPVLLTYPPEIRDRLLPLVAETLVAGGELAPAAALLDARKDDPALGLARAMLQEAKGDSAGALASYDRVATSPDQSLHARAATRAVELRLASGAIDARQAADRLESLLYSWRGDHRERALRERLAGLRSDTGSWRAALALLRDSETLFPDDKAAIRAELTGMFAALLRGDTADSLAPLELVAVVEENADLLPDGADGEALQAKLADRLVALDLPKRAGPALEKLMQAATSGVVRAGFGARLAALRLREGDAAGVLAALDASVAADLPAELAERRTLLVAAANARRGDTAGAMAALGTIDSAAADEARATILERANDWPAAQRALTAYAAKTVPTEGGLDDAQRRTLLRLATATARAGDNAGLTALRVREGGRMGPGPIADMFRLLTADQISSAADLKRSGQETALARELPAQLKALQVSAPTPSIRDAAGKN